MNDEEGYLGWALAGVTTVIATLAGIVTKFYQKQLADSDKREGSLTTRITAIENDYRLSREEIKECHKQREEIRVELAAVKTRLEILESKIHGQEL